MARKLSAAAHAKLRKKEVAARAVLRTPKKVPQGERGSLGAHLIVNDLAPVTAYLREDVDATRKDPKHPVKTRTFKNLAEFKAWYSPKAHVMVQTPNTQADFTDVCLESLKDAGRTREQAAKHGAAAPRKKGGEPTFGSGSVAVSVGGTRYGTIKGALAKLGIPDSERKALRKTLIEKGEASLTHAGKTHTFKRED